jgi:hypothetical protein
MKQRRTALVTGASSGIGEAFARMLSDEGYNLMLTSRSGDRLQELSRELSGDKGVTVSWVAEDLENPEAPARILEACLVENMDVDLLVNNAGFGAYGSFSESEIGESRAMIQVLISALTDLTHLFLPPMLRRGSGGVINVGSTGSLLPCANMAVYCAAKAYVLSLTEALSMELKGSDVTVTALLPGNTSTGFSGRAGTGHTRVARYMPMSSDAVARIGYKAHLRGKPVVVAGRTNSLQMKFVSLLPRCMVRSVTRYYLNA